MTKSKLKTPLAKLQSKLEKRIVRLEKTIKKLFVVIEKHKEQKRLDAKFKDCLREKYPSIYKEIVESITNKKFAENGEFEYKDRMYRRLKNEQQT